MSTALVTGATAGIGLAFAEELARRGHDLVLVARDEPRLQAVAERLRGERRVQVEVVSADLASRADVELVAARIGDPNRPIDVLVNNAGFGLRGSFLDNPVADEERMLDVLCRAVLVLSHAAGRAMRDRGEGSIVNVSSVPGFVAMGTYSAAKSWVTVFSEVLAGDLAGSGVSVVALCPGFTRTEFHARAEMDMSRLPDWLWLDAERLVADCLDDLARGAVVSVPGRPYKVLVGALSVLPRRLVRRASAAMARERRGGASAPG